MSLSLRVFLSRKMSDWATLFDNDPEECLCTFNRDYRQFFTDEEQALLDLYKERPCGCMQHDESDDVLDDLDGLYFPGCGVEVNRKVRERFARILEGFCDRIDSCMRPVNEVVYSKSANELSSNQPEIVQTAMAVFPVYAKFDKTCDPDVVEINCAEYLVVRARRPIKKGKAVTRASFTSYLDGALSEREDVASARHVWCGDCRPCIEDWVDGCELRSRAEDQTILINCPKCGNCLGNLKKILDLSPSKTCGKNGCDESIGNILDVAANVVEAAAKPTTKLNLPKSVEEGEKDLAEALQLVTEARKLFPSPCIFVALLEHLADVLFIRLGNARRQSPEDSDKIATVYRAPCYLAYHVY